MIAISPYLSNYSTVANIPTASSHSTSTSITMDASIENELPQLQDLRQEMQGMCQNFEQRIEKISENIQDLRRDMQSVQASIETNFDDMQVF